MHDPEFHKREDIRFGFVTRFLPEGVPSGHKLLFDFFQESSYVPNAAELNGCLSAYLGLLRTVPREAPREIVGRGMLAASELALAILGRAVRADCATLVSDTAQELQHEIDFLLAGLKRFNPSWVGFDACKRMRRILKLLENLGED